MPALRPKRIAQVAMVDSFSCSCGEPLTVPPSYTGHKLFCLRCRRSIPIPGRTPKPPEPAPLAVAGVSGARPEDARDAPPMAALVPLIGDAELTPDKSDDLPTIEVGAPVHFEWVLGPGGTEYWKLTCRCGKRLLSPAPSLHPYGKCPKCGLRLPLPGYDDSPKVIRVPARPGTSGNDEVRDDRTTTAAAAALNKTSSDPKISLTAASTAADRLRPKRPSAQARASRPVSGRISAWPLAGRSRRLLATFLDLCLGTCVASVVMALAGPHVLEPLFSPAGMLLATIWLTMAFNDSVIHLIWGGSLGKSLVVLVVRTEDGEPSGAVRTLVRALLKWLLIPGWLIGAFDSAERTLHDLLAGTLVLRGRSRHKMSGTDSRK